MHTIMISVARASPPSRSSCTPMPMGYQALVDTSACAEWRRGDWCSDHPTVRDFGILFSLAPPATVALASQSRRAKMSNLSHCFDVWPRPGRCGDWFSTRKACSNTRLASCWRAPNSRVEREATACAHVQWTMRPARAAADCGHSWPSAAPCLRAATLHASCVPRDEHSLSA